MIYGGKIMRTYVVTDGLMLSKDKDAIFPLLKGKDGTLYVNGYSFCTENAERICQCIKEEKESSLFEIGCALGEIRSLVEREKNSSVFSLPYDEDTVYVSVLKETEDLVKPFTSSSLFPFNLLFTNTPKTFNENKKQETKCNSDEVKSLKEDEKISKTNRRENKNDSSSNTLNNDSEKTYLRSFDNNTKSKKRKSKKDSLPEKGVPSVVLSDNEDKLSDNKDNIQSKNEKESTVLSEDNTMFLYPETLDELAKFPIKNEKGTRITQDGRIAILHLRDFGSSKIAEVTGIPQATISALYSNLKTGRLNITAEQVESAVEDRKKMISGTNDSTNTLNGDVNVAEKNEEIEEENSKPTSDITAPMLAVPILMEKQMKYDKNMPGLENISIAGYPLSGNIITDSENALGYRLSRQDKDVLINAFFSLRAYEETFITDLQFGNFSHMEDVPKLKEVCTIFEKIRKIKALGRKKK